MPHHPAGLWAASHKDGEPVVQMPHARIISFLQIPVPQIEQTDKKCAVLIHGKRARILGRVCMDQFMVDVTDIPETKFMDQAVLIGEDGDDRITVEELADLSGRFNYEFVCCLGKRIPRVYKRFGKITE